MANAGRGGEKWAQEERAANLGYEIKQVARVDHGGSIPLRPPDSQSSHL